jgi:large conductance mechanosensitive channel
MLKEFQAFINRGNVIDLAVAVIIGGAFNAIITSIVNDLIMPLIGMLLGGIDFTSLALTVNDAKITYGNLIQAILNFLIVAFVLFLIVRAYNRMAVKKEEAPPAPTTQECPYCRTQIHLKASRCPHCTSQLHVV